MRTRTRFAAIYRTWWLSMSLLMSACGGGLQGQSQSGAVSDSGGRFTLSGMLTGLAHGQQVTLVNNGTDTLTVTSDGHFTFNSPLNQGASYTVTVATQPVGQTCTASDNYSPSMTSNVTQVQVICSDQALHSFSGGTDGSHPFAGLVMDSSGMLYGTTVAGGGSNNKGTIFMVPGNSPNQFKALYAFDPATTGYESVNALVVDSKGNLYGTTTFGGQNGSGTMFKINRSTGAPAIVMYAYPKLMGRPDWANHPALVPDKNGEHLYSVVNTASGKTISKISTTFPYGQELLANVATSYDEAGVIADKVDSYLYGTTVSGGKNGYGTLYSVTTTLPATVTELYSFSGGSDGGYPSGGLTFDKSGSYLLGTTGYGGAYGQGTVFKY